MNRRSFLATSLASIGAALTYGLLPKNASNIIPEAPILEPVEPLVLETRTTYSSISTLNSILKELYTDHPEYLKNLVQPPYPVWAKA